MRKRDRQILDEFGIKLSLARRTRIYESEEVNSANPATVAGSPIQRLMDREILNLEIGTGQKCKVIYLGLEEWLAFEALAKQVCVIPLNAGNEFTCPDYCGRKIYKVDAQNYLAAGL